VVAVTVVARGEQNLRHAS